MTVTAVNYAKDLYELSVSDRSVQTTKEIFREVPGAGRESGESTGAF